MISDAKLMKLSLASAVFGLVAIYAVTLFIGPEITAISSIDENYAGRHVIVNATIVTRVIKDGNIFLTLEDGSGNITAVLFERTARNNQETYGVVEGDKALVNGQINIYKGELEIIVNSVILWK